MKKYILESNKMLAEFMGYSFYENNNKYYILKWIDNNTVYFNPEKDWNQLIKIIDKIESIGCIIEINFCLGYNCRICYVGNKHEEARNFSNMSSSIDVVYNTVVEFVEWYINKK